MPDLSNAILISIIGLGLVLAAEILLWLGMELLVRLTAGRRPLQPAADAAASADQAFKRQAALAAVAAALAQDADMPRVFPSPFPNTVSAWQAVTRARQLKQQGPVR